MMAVTEPGLARIPLADGISCLIDALDVDLVSTYKWQILDRGRGTLYVYHAGKNVYMHRLILGTPTGMETDHINGDGLDNRRANLRVATPGQNRANSWKPKRPDGATHSSIYKGVSWDKSRGKWQAKICYQGRSMNLGRYTDEVEAALAYDRAAGRYFGEFGRTNFNDAIAAV